MTSTDLTSLSKYPQVQRFKDWSFGSVYELRRVCEEKSPIRGDVRLISSQDLLFGLPLFRPKSEKRLTYNEDKPQSRKGTEGSRSVLPPRVLSRNTHSEVTWYRCSTVFSQKRVKVPFDYNNGGPLSGVLLFAVPGPSQRVRQQEQPRVRVMGGIDFSYPALWSEEVSGDLYFGCINFRH